MNTLKEIDINYFLIHYKFKNLTNNKKKSEYNLFELKIN
jgi:hypothetical protein